MFGNVIAAKCTWVTVYYNKFLSTAAWL